MRLAKFSSLLLLLTALTGCSGAGYYGQSIRGQLSILMKRRSLETVLADPRVDPSVRAKLERVVEIRDFASRELDLPDNGSYRSYVELDRDYVVWNVVATPEFSTEAVTWCFPIVGCVAYRGYFSEPKAESFAAGLAAAGYDTTVDGVTAYSTLGWFHDPVLSTFLDRSEAGLAALLFHELAHQKVYVKGDSVFNESYATTVELAGLDRYLDADAAVAARESARLGRERQAEFSRLVAEARGALQLVFGDASLSDAEKRRRKAAVFEDLRRSYRDTKEAWGGYAGYDAWFAQDLNNAVLASVGTYSSLVPELQDLLASLGGDLGAFHVAVKELGRLSLDDRRQRLMEARLTAAPPVPGSR